MRRKRPASEEVRMHEKGKKRARKIQKEKGNERENCNRVW